MSLMILFIPSVYSYLYLVYSYIEIFVYSNYMRYMNTRIPLIYLYMYMRNILNICIAMYFAYLDYFVYFNMQNMSDMCVF